MNLIPTKLNKKKFWTIKDVSKPTKKTLNDEINTVCTFFIFKKSFLLKIKKQNEHQHQYVIPLRYTRNEVCDFYTCFLNKKFIVVYEDEIVENVCCEIKQYL